jgi:hypothetical protein
VAVIVGGCSRVPVCLLDALRRGAEVNVGKVGEKWAVKVDGKPIARRKHKAAAEDLLAAARGEVLRASVQAEQESQTPPTEERRRAVLLTPQRPAGEAVRFELLEASQLVTSHRPSDFQPEAAYPEGVQERRYHAEAGEQLKVQRGADALNPELLLARTPVPTDGPPLVTDGPFPIALGGNGRGMMLRRAYHQRTEGARRYREALATRAAEFGFTRAQVEAMREPVLVRVVEGLHREAPRPELVAAVRRFNESLTQRMDPTTLAVAQSRVLTPEALRAVGELLVGGDATLRDVMRERPRAVVEALTRAGVVTEHNRAEWLTEAEGLTEQAKDQLEGMFLGAVLGTADRIKATAPSLLQRIERAVPYLVAVGSTLPPAFDLRGHFVAAVDALNEARRRGVSLDSLGAQVALFGPGLELDPTAKALARLLDSSGPRVVGDAFRRWAQRVDHAPGQATMFFDPPTPEAGLLALLGRVPNPSGCGCREVNPRKQARAPEPTVRCERCAGAGRVSPWAGRIDWCPTCNGAGTTRAPSTAAPAGQMRLINAGRRPKSERLTTNASTTGKLAGELVERYGGTGFPAKVQVKTNGGQRLGLHFDGADLTRATIGGRADAKLLGALRADLAKRNPIV